MPLPPLVLNRRLAREVDRLAVEEYGLSGIVLMENAGRSAAELIPDVSGHDRPVVFACGKGNNAGDAFVMARHLEARGRPVSILLWADPDELSPDAAANFNVLAKSGTEIHVFGSTFDRRETEKLLEEAFWVVDGLLGTGAQGEPHPPLDGVIDAINSQHEPILALDLPSGLDCDSGKPARHTIRATVTCTFVAPKVGFAKRAAEPYVGVVHVAEIGIPRVLRERISRMASGM